MVVYDLSETNLKLISKSMDSKTEQLEKWYLAIYMYNL